MPQAEAETFQHYRVLRRDDGSLWKLGAGAMGVTYKAIDTNLDALVALKVINAVYTGSGVARERFIREAKAAASLRHRNVASIHHLGADEQSFFYAMEFIDGETVEHFIKREGPQSWRLALPTALQVTRALMAAHEKRIVHRDIKPANIMLVREVGEDDLTVKLIDFGLAKALVEEGGSVVNVSGSGFLGTPLYASPEQCEELAPDIRSDIYSLGVTLWFVLTGRPPFEGGLGKVFAQHLHSPPPWVQLPAALPEPVRALLARMLAKDRADRPQTPAVLRHEIEMCLRACGQSVPAAAPMPVAQAVAAPMGERLVAETLSKTPALAPAAVAPPEAQASEPPSAGFSLEDVLRRNGGRLPATLVANLLGPVAQIVDAAGSAEFVADVSNMTYEEFKQVVDAGRSAELDLTPGGVRIVAGDTGAQPPRAVPFTDALLTEGLPGWLEVRPLDAARPADLASDQTMPPTHARFTEPAPALAALAYELLDGTAPVPGRSYRPLSECDEESNALLRRALEGGPGAFAEAGTFAAALGPVLRRRPAKSATAQPPSFVATAPPEESRSSVIPLRSQAAERHPWAAPPEDRFSAVSLSPVTIIVSAVAALLVLTAVGTWMFFPSSKEPVARPATAIPTPEPTPTVEPAAGSPPKINTTPSPREDYQTGVDLWYGMGRTLISKPQAVSHFQAAAAGGYAPAQAFLALAYQDQEGSGAVQKDAVQAQKWAKASLEAGLREQAQQGDAEAQLRLGRLYEEGIGVEKDMSKAVELYKRAAAQGNASAQNAIGACYEYGSGEEKDLAKSFEAYRNSADQEDAYAQYNLGVCYDRGIGVEKDLAKAAEYYKKAADQGDEDAQASLGNFYQNGIGVEKDLNKAVELYKKAADQGNAYAQNRLRILRPETAK